MRYSFVDILSAMSKTLLLLVILEIISTAIFPALGLIQFKLAFSVLIVLFMAFKLDTPALPYLILVIQLFHAAFSIEGWGVGTLAGVLIAISMRYLRDMLEFSSNISTIVVVQIFQIAWFVIINILLCIKLNDFSHLMEMIWRYVPPSIFLSLLSPYFFKLLDRFWMVGERNRGASF